MKTAVVQACDKCDCTSPVAAAFVQCFADGEVPAAAVSKKIMEAKIAIEDHIGDEGLKASAQANRDFTNSGLRGEVYNYCYKCYGKAFKGSEDYYVTTVDGQTKEAVPPKLKAEWYNLRKRRSARGRVCGKEDDIIDYLLTKAERNLRGDANAAKRQDLNDVLERIKEQPEVVRASDWNPMLSPDVWMLYRCAKCFMAPVQLSHWIRAIEPGEAHKDGNVEAKGDWRCAIRYHWDDKTCTGGACLTKWTHGGGTGRAIVINREWGEWTDGKKVEIFLIGSDITQEEDHVLQLLRAANLIQVLPESIKKGEPIPKSQLLDAIEKLNARCSESLMRLAECRTVRGVVYEDFKERCPTKEPYACDARLSFAHGGQLFKALYIAPETPAVPAEFRADLISCLCAYHDFSMATRPKRPGPKRNAYDFVQEAGPYWLEHGKAYKPGA